MEILKTQLTFEELEQIYKMCKDFKIVDVKYSPPSDSLYKTYEFWDFRQVNGYSPFKIVRHHDGDKLHLWRPL